MALKKTVKKHHLELFEFELETIRTGLMLIQNYGLDEEWANAQSLLDDLSEED